MSLAVMTRLFGDKVAESIAIGTEYDWHKDSGWDPCRTLLSAGTWFRRYSRSSLMRLRMSVSSTNLTR